MLRETVGRSGTITQEQLVIFQAQEYLRNSARLYGDISMVYPDGIYGEETVKAVTDFQRKHNIAQTGLIDFETWEKLVQENEKAVFMASEPIQTAKISKEDLPLTLGMENSLVYTLKLMLNSVAQAYEGFEVLPLSNSFGSDTQEQVRLWQKVVSAEQTGVVDKFTWNTLSEFYLLAEE